jgi:tRNA threonylcarbamoyladenosine biosynthesis protein TsaE
MKDLSFPDCSLEDLASIAQRILETYNDERVFAFFGDLGAGKTTLIKHLCKALGVTESVTSPSFAIVNEYVAGGIDLVYHFDFYRIKKLEEVLDIGYEEYLFGDSYCFLEWADKIGELLPESYVYVSVGKGSNNNVRTITTRIID